MFYHDIVWFTQGLYLVLKVWNSFGILKRPFLGMKQTKISLLGKGLDLWVFCNYACSISLVQFHKYKEIGCKVFENIKRDTCDLYFLKMADMHRMCVCVCLHACLCLLVITCIYKMMTMSVRVKLCVCGYDGGV